MISIFSFLLEQIIDHGLSKTEYREFAEWNNIYNGTINAETIINGSSRAWVQVSPKIIDSVTKTNSYNLGMDGYYFLMQYYRYQIYKKYNTAPKRIIQILGITTLGKRDDLCRHYQFLPYFHDNIIKTVTKKYFAFNYFDYIIPSLKYFNERKILYIGLVEFLEIKHFTNSKYKGYLGAENKWDGSFDQFKKRYPTGLDAEINNESVELFDNFLNDSKNNSIDVILVYAPEYVEGHKYFNNRNDVIQIYKNAAKKYGFSFIDFSNDPISLDKSLFYNSQHLNKQGAELFSHKLAAYIDNIQNKNKQ